MNTKDVYCCAFKKGKYWWCCREGVKQRDGVQYR